MDEIEKFQQEIEELKKENAKLKETLETIENINRTNEIGQYIQQCKRALMMTNLMNTVSVKKTFDGKQLTDEVNRAAAEKSSLDKKIKEALNRAVYESAIVSESEYRYKEVPGGIEIQSITMNSENKTICVIPSEINEKAVVGIGKNAFQNKRMVEVKLPNTLKYIGEYAFWECVHLEKVELSESLETIGKFAFSGTGLKEIRIPKNVKKIPYMCFAGCLNLNNVVLENGIEYIETRAFKNTSITKLILPESIKKLGAEIVDKRVAVY